MGYITTWRQVQSLFYAPVSANFSCYRGNWLLVKIFDLLKVEENLEEKSIKMRKRKTKFLVASQFLR